MRAQSFTYSMRATAWLRSKSLYIFVSGMVLTFAVLLASRTAIQEATPDWLTSNITQVQDTFLNVGSQLIGISALVFGLVTFALQANLERMPFTLFARLTSDKWLLMYFGLAFAISVVVVALSLLVERSNVGFLVLLFLAALCSILLLIFLSFRRALILVNPGYQLQSVIAGTKKSFRRWERAFQLHRPLMPDPPAGAQRDMKRAAFFNHHSHWTTDAKRSIEYATAYVRHYANVGDFEVSGAGIDTLVEISRLYVQAKGDTFVGEIPFLAMGTSTDGIVNLTLEQLRQLAEFGANNGNETLIEQSMGGMKNLVYVYSKIEYGQHLDTKTHANNAVGYLDRATQTAARHKLTDVVMQGVRFLGESGAILLVAKSGTAVSSIADDLGKYGLLGTVRADDRPVTQEVMRQLASLTVQLLRSEAANLRFAGDSLRAAAKLVSLPFLQIPGGPAASVHDAYLGPYLTGQLPDQMTALANAVVAAEEDDAAARRVAGNTKEWAGGLSEFCQEIMIAAIGRQSMIAVGLFHTTAQWVRVLSVIAAAPAAAEHSLELKERAVELVYTFARVPDDAQSVGFAETCSIHRVIEELAFDIARQPEERLKTAIAQVIVEWAAKAIKFNARLGSAQSSLATLAAFFASRELGEVPPDIRAQIQRRFRQPDISPEQLAAVTQRVRRAYIGRRREEFAMERLERELNRINRQRFEAMLGSILDVLEAPPAGG